MQAAPVWTRIGELLLLVIGLAGLVFGWPILQANALVGLVPMIASFFITAFALIAIIRPDEEAEAWPWRSALLLIGELIAYLVLMNVLGYPLDTAAFVVGASLTVGIRRWTTIALAVAVLLVISIGIFQSLLGVALPPGSIL